MVDESGIVASEGILACFDQAVDWLRYLGATAVYRYSYRVVIREFLVYMRTVYSFYLDAAKIALQSIFAHKLRAFLTLIGIIIGVASVVVVGASIEGLNTYMVETISRVLGANHFMIAASSTSGRRPRKSGRR
jgi:hypothetical protein